MGDYSDPRILMTETRPKNVQVMISARDHSKGNTDSHRSSAGTPPLKPETPPNKGNPNILSGINSAIKDL